MLITRALLHAMEKAENPRAIRMLSRSLELSTGLRATDVLGSLQRKNTESSSFSTTDTTVVRDWYQENGYKLLSAIGGARSYSGQTISVDTALQSAAFLAGVKLIAEDVGTIPFEVYERSQDRKNTDKAISHSLYPVLHDLWNPEVSAGEGVEALTAHAIMTGNGYAAIVRVDGQVKQLYPLQPQQVTTKRDEAGNLWYEYREKGGPRLYPRTDILHLKGFTLNGASGESLLERARHVIGLTLATQEYAARYFSQGSILDVVLERPAGQTALGPTGVQLLKDGWVNYGKGLDGRAFGVRVLQEGVTAKILTPKHSETQLIEQRKFQVLEVCRLLRLTPHKLAEMERSAYASIEAENIAYIQLTLSPWVRRWKQAVHRCLLTPEEQVAGRLYAEQNVEALQRGDFTTQMNGFRVGLDKGVYSINDVRHWFNMNPIPGGDEHRVQINTVAIAEAAAQLAEAARGE